MPLLPKIAALVFDVLLFVVWPLQMLKNEWIVPRLLPKLKRRRDLKSVATQLRHKHHWDRDRLPETDTAELLALSAEADRVRRGEDDPKQADRAIAHGVHLLDRLSPRTRWHSIKETLEVLVVVFGVVMGIRALFLQPFKIPTGSMQPTLYGIHFVEAGTDAVEAPWWKRVLDYANYSRRYAWATVVEDGHLDRMVTRYPLGFINHFLFPYTEVRIGSHAYRLPGDEQAVYRYLREYREKHYPNQPYFEKGQTLVHGYHQLGDHLFVDRVRFNFVEPQRGDITVFITDGIKRRDGGALRGRYYIKRLVGLPGDELKIVHRELYVKARGETEFKRIDGHVSPAFDRLYSYRGGNCGYSNPTHPSAQYLRTEEDTFTLHDDEYFMLGDNTENSQDSRFWGVVPRHNIVGRASFVYWPFLRRWGCPDRVPAEDFPSQPPES